MNTDGMVKITLAIPPDQVEHFLEILKKHCNISIQMPTQEKEKIAKMLLMDTKKETSN